MADTAGVKKIASIAVLAVALVGAGPAASAPTTSPIAHASCAYHVIAGARKCIAAGQFCQHSARANRDYHKYGYTCGKRDYNGRYHLTYY